MVSGGTISVDVCLSLYLSLRHSHSLSLESVEFIEFSYPLGRTLPGPKSALDQAHQLLRVF